MNYREQKMFQTLKENATAQELIEMCKQIYDELNVGALQVTEKDLKDAIESFEQKMAKFDLCQDCAYKDECRLQCRGLSL